MYNHYSGDPYWTSARFQSTCTTCKKSIKKGERIFYYPKTKSVYCSECGQDEYARFRSMAEDEYAYNR